MTAPEPPGAAPVAVGCPRCPGTLEGADEERTCTSCRRTARVVLFEPVTEAKTVAAGSGRCAHHPNKDAVAGCTRCGSFVCDVCLTRTGEQSLCPACFDTMHQRGALATTVSRRARWDHIVLLLGFVSIVCWPLGIVSIPAAVGIGAWALAKRRSEPWLSLPHLVIGMVLAVVVGGLIAAGMLTSMLGRGT